jgi:hypothetical protein
MTRDEAAPIILASWRKYKRKKWLRDVAARQGAAIPYGCAKAKGWALMVDASTVRVTTETANIVPHTFVPRTVKN